MLDLSLKHTFHVATICLFIAFAEVGTFLHQSESVETHHYDHYGYFISIFLHIMQYIVLLPIPLIVFNFLGLTFFNAFPDKIEINKQQWDDFSLKPNNSNLPHLCFRVVTRGLYPELVQYNVNKNFLTCIESGFSNFSIEVVTDKEIPMTNMDPRVRQIVIPSSYRTPTGALYKARALQYALEPQVSLVDNGDYIVHLDEETILTRNVLNGITNFAMDGKHAFGQGLITYTNLGIVNWFTTLADFFRVAEDMGKIRFQFKVFHKPIFGWKGSFVVAKYEAEKDVSFDHGPDGSISEDCFFAMIAYKKGYSFDFIDGVMYEKSPFTVPDLIRQRKRWFQGVWLVVHSPEIPLKIKFILMISLYAWATLPLVGLSYILAIFFPVPTPIWYGSIGSFCFAVSIYMYIFGVLKSFDSSNTSKAMFIVYLIGLVFAIPFNLIMEDIAIVWGLFGAKHSFFIVEKDLSRKVVLEA